MYCRTSGGCSGALALSALIGHGHGLNLHQGFTIAGGTTVHIPVHVPKPLVALARKHRKGVPMQLTATVAGKAVAQTITLRIF